MKITVTAKNFHPPAGRPIDWCIFIYTWKCMCSKRRYLLLNCLCFFFYSYAQQIPEDAAIRLFLIPDSAANQVRLNASRFNSFQPYAIKHGILKDAIVLRQLTDGISIVSFPTQSAKENAQKNAAWIVPVNNKWKLSPAILQQTATDPNDTAMARLIIIVTDVNAFLHRYRDLRSLSVDAVDEITGTIQLKTSASWINTAMADPLITFIAKARQPKVERELTGFDLSTNKVNLAQRTMPGINGHGLTVSIKENRPDTLDMDLQGRYRYSSIASATMQTHATTMATIVAGGGNSFYTGKGVAWNAFLSSADFANLLPDNNNELQRLNISVQNHSYGVGIENYYGADAAAHDAQQVQMPNLLHIFSAGNLGDQASTSGNYAGITGYANLSGSFKMAKNNLLVGSIDSFGVVPTLSSRGPAFDGRLKPELVALGEDGSSGAAAIVSGVALLVQDAWQQKNGSLPNSSMVKAILVNSADDVNAKGIDFVSGYGSVNAYRALQTVIQNRILQGQVQQSQTITHQLSIPSNAQHFKLSICWTDPPAQANTYKALVNDIDLELYNPSTGDRWLPWVLNTAANADSLRQLPVRKRDSLNTIEQITLDNPAAGNYEVRVKGTSVTGSQAYSLAWQYDTVGHLLITYPVKGDNIFPKQTHTIRWETTIGGAATLQYRINNGNWNSPVSIDLSKNYFQWQAPDSIGALQLRIAVAGREWLSDTAGLAPNLPINTGFNCTDSFLVYWQRAAVDSYRVYRLGPQYLESFLNLSDTALLQYKQNNPYQFFTIAPMLPFRIEGPRSYTFNYTQQQVGCYVSSFVADPSGNSNAKLNLQLGTTFNVAKVVFEKWGATGFSSIHSFSPIPGKQITSLEIANHGLNTYRARVELKSGTVYYTPPEKVFIFAGQSYYVFPNPVQQGMPLRVLTEDPDDVTIRVFDSFGRKLAEQKVNSFLTDITLPLLQKGIYFYSITKSGSRQEARAFAVQ